MLAPVPPPISRVLPRLRPAVWDDTRLNARIEKVVAGGEEALAEFVVFHESFGFLVFSCQGIGVAVGTGVGEGAGVGVGARATCPP